MIHKSKTSRGTFETIVDFFKLASSLLMNALSLGTYSFIALLEFLAQPLSLQHT